MNSKNYRELRSIYGLGETYIELLHKAGIFSVDQLRLHNAADLREQIAHVVETYNIGRIPSRANVEDWVEQANLIYAQKQNRMLA